MPRGPGRFGRWRAAPPATIFRAWSRSNTATP